MREACENNNDHLLGSDKKTAVSTGKECRELRAAAYCLENIQLPHYMCYSTICIQHATLGSYMYIIRDGTPLCAVKLTIYNLHALRGSYINLETIYTV